MLAKVFCSNENYLKWQMSQMANDLSGSCLFFLENGNCGNWHFLPVAILTMAKIHLAKVLRGNYSNGIWDSWQKSQMANIQQALWHLAY